VGLDFVERVGLRYLDRIVPMQKGETLQAYIAPAALGLQDLLGGEAMHSFCETLSQVGDIKLLVRVFTRSAELGFPPDIPRPPLDLLPRFRTPSSALHAVMDSDGFVERREKYSIDNVHKCLNSIHTVISSAFESITTPHARKMWSK
jgi:uncharacterized protein (TIGR04255 family)